MAENKNPPPVKRGPGSTKKAVEKAKDFKGTTKKLVKNYLSIYKWQMIIVIIFAIGSTIFTIVGPKVLGNATTEIFNGLVGKVSGGDGINFSNQPKKNIDKEIIDKLYGNILKSSVSRFEQ